MIPILFESNEKAFTSNGIGRLSDAMSCKVTEERNGVFTVELTYPVEGALYDDLIFGRYIYVECSQGNRQPFEIYASTKPINGKVTFYGRHISYRASLIPVRPFSVSSASAAITGLKTNAMEECPFTMWTNKDTVGSYKQTAPASIRSRLGGVQGSILDVYGGEYEWDMWNIRLWSSRGSDKGVQLRYGKNITDLNQEESIENTITGVVAYWTDTEGNAVYSDVISSEYAANYPYPRTTVIDVSSDFEDEPTKAQVTAAGRAYLSANNIGVPKVNLSVSFVNLAQTEEYKDIAVLETVNLCDTVTVIFEKLGVSATAKVIKTEWDVLAGKYEKIELGEARSNLSSKIAEQEARIEEKPSGDALQKAINHATSLITGETGGYVVLHTDEATGKPYEILIMDTDDINTARNVWRWNKSGWGHSSTGYTGPYTLAATLDGGIVADYITTGRLTGIEINNGNGTFRVDAAGNMTATSGSFTGDITGSNITGSTLTGDAINGGTITGATLTGDTINGGTVNGAAINCGDSFSVTADGFATMINGSIRTIVGNVESGNYDYLGTSLDSAQLDMAHYYDVGGSKETTISALDYERLAFVHTFEGTRTAGRYTSGYSYSSFNLGGSTMGGYVEYIDNEDPNSAMRGTLHANNLIGDHIYSTQAGIEIYNDTGDSWSHRLSFQPDGNLVIYDSSGNAVWSAW